MRRVAAIAIANVLPMSDDYKCAIANTGADRSCRKLSGQQMMRSQAQHASGRASCLPANHPSATIFTARIQPCRWKARAEVGPFCRNVLRDLSRQATRCTLLTGQRGAVEGTSRPSLPSRLSSGRLFMPRAGSGISEIGPGTCLHIP